MHRAVIPLNTIYQYLATTVSMYLPGVTFPQKSSSMLLANKIASFPCDDAGAMAIHCSRYTVQS